MCGGGFFAGNARVGTSSRRVTRYHTPRLGGPRYVLVPHDAKVLVVEDMLHRQLVFLRQLGSAARIVNSSERAIEALQCESYTWIFLDYDLGFGRTTEEFARYLVKVQFAGSIVIHSSNPFGVAVLEKICRDGGITNVGVVPFDLLGLVRERSNSLRRPW